MGAERRNRFLADLLLASAPGSHKIRYEERNRRVFGSLEFFIRAASDD